MELQEIIKQSSFTLVGDSFVYVKAKKRPTASHFLVSEDSSEITVVTEENRLSELEYFERNKDTYALFALNVSVPFYSVGLLALVSKTIADAGMNILIVSTYSKDYILVKREHTEKTKELLASIGFSESL